MIGVWYVQMNDFYFMGQKIVNLLKYEDPEYELLLRSHSVPGFPEKEYVSYMVSEDKHLEYLYFLECELIRILELNPGQRFSLNLDQQELEYDATLEFLCKIDVKLRGNLTIEITELPPIKRHKNYPMTINVDVIRDINLLGYRVSLDDVTQGNNSIGNILLVMPYIHQIKWSYVHVLNRIPNASIEDLIQFLNKLSQQFDLELVIEGIEASEISDWLVKNNITNQQGFLFAKPAGVAPIKLI